MSIETILLVLESILLVFTIALLIFSIREGRLRDKHLVEVEKATRILTRQEYFLTVMDAMTDAEEEIIGSITGRFPADQDRKRLRGITEDIKKLIRKGIGIKYLIPKFPDRLFIGHLYSSVGAEVRYSSCLMVQDIRYIVSDHKLVVLGIPDSTGNKEATKKGYRIPSEGLASMLEENFLNCWEKGKSYEVYAREVIRETGASPKNLARELHIDEKELERLASQ
jgi:hypothetical protein